MQNTRSNFFFLIVKFRSESVQFCKKKLDISIDIAYLSQLGFEAAKKRLFMKLFNVHIRYPPLKCSQPLHHTQDINIKTGRRKPYPDDLHIKQYRRLRYILLHKLKNGAPLWKATGTRGGGEAKNT